MLNRETKDYFFKNIDIPIIIIYLLLVTVGYINIYSVSTSEIINDTTFFNYYPNRQLIWIIISLFIGFIILTIRFHLLDVVGYFIYFLGIFFLIIVLFFGTEISGAKSWLRFAGFSFQPSELSKFTTAIGLAKFASDNLNKYSLNVFLTFAIGIILLPLFLILLENDTGSSIIFLFFIFALHRLNFSSLLIVFGLYAILVCIISLFYSKVLIITSLFVFALLIIYIVGTYNEKIVIFISVVLLASFLMVYSFNFFINDILEPHQKKRINVLLNIEKDSKGAGYNIEQSLIAIGSGGFSGKGFLNGTQTKLKFIPEQKTDFIFCTIGEEWGFLGTFITILLYVCLLLRLIILAEDSRNIFVKIYGYSITSVLFGHFVINIGMVIGILPVIGLPLPLISYGGTSILVFTIMIFVFISLKSRENFFIK